MEFKEFSKYLQRLEKTSLRNEMVKILADLFLKVDKKEIERVSYLITGRVMPLFEPVEFGMGERMVIRAIGEAFSKTKKEVGKEFKKEGDLGKVAEKLSKNPRLELLGKEEGKKDINYVYEKLLKLAKAEGEGSQEEKIKILASLFLNLDSLSVRYLARIPVNKLRLGFSDMTILEAYSWMIKKDKSLKEKIEEIYKIRPDLGYIGRVLKEKGMKGLKKIKIKVGAPILMAKCERLNTAEEILEKGKGKMAVENKLDGFRCQVHKNGKKVEIYSRNLEDTTYMYPDLVEGTLAQVKAKKVIFEGEAVAYDEKKGEYLPFQETVQRKRKYGIEKMAKKIPLRLFCFECLFLEGKKLINKPYIKRRRELEKILKEGKRLKLMKMEIVEKEERLEELFLQAAEKGLEGVVAKKLDGEYQAGARGWNWIKFKRGFSGMKVRDTIDCLVMGYDYGKGKRASFGIGDFLVGVYDKEKDKFKTVAKIGTGLKDKQWKKMKKRCDVISSEKKPVLYEVDKMMECDVWVKPGIVVEIRADEITKSPVHTAGKEKGKSGYGLRFPRLIGFRDDKRKEDTTSEEELIEMFENQQKVKTKSLKGKRKKK